jgi:hypothetical protein
MFATSGISSGFGPRCYPRLLLRGDAESDARFAHMKVAGRRYKKWASIKRARRRRTCDLRRLRATSSEGGRNSLSRMGPIRCCTAKYCISRRLAVQKVGASFHWQAVVRGVGMSEVAPTV